MEEGFAGKLLCVYERGIEGLMTALMAPFYDSNASCREDE